MPRSITSAAIGRDHVSTGLDYADLVGAFERELGRWDPAIGASLVSRNAPWTEVQRDVGRLAGAHGLMIFLRIDQGEITSLHRGAKRCSLYLVGNPVIAEQILSIDIRACLYVPFRVCLYDDGGPDGAVMSFDRPSSFLVALGRPELAAIGALLDDKIDGVVRAIRKTTS